MLALVVVFRRVIQALAPAFGAAGAAYWPGDGRSVYGGVSWSF